MDGQDHWLVLTSNLIYSINQGCTDTGVQYSTRIRKICAITMTQIPVYVYVLDNFGGGFFHFRLSQTKASFVKAWTAQTRSFVDLTNLIWCREVDHQNQLIKSGNGHNGAPLNF